MLLFALGLLAGAVGVAGAAPVGKLRFVDAKVDGQGPVTGLANGYGAAVSADGKNLPRSARPGGS